MHPANHNLSLLAASGSALDAQPSPRKPPSEAQLRANRQNARRSTGPRTEEGKRRSSLNAMRHGFTAQTLSLPQEELAALNHTLSDFEIHYQPVGIQEKHLVHMLAQMQYRLHRIMACEHTLFTIGLAENGGKWDVNHPEAHTAFVFADTLRHAKDPLLTVSLYEARLYRQYEKTLRLLLSLQADRHAAEPGSKENSEPASEPAIGFVCSDKRMPRGRRHNTATQCREQYAAAAIAACSGGKETKYKPNSSLKLEKSGPNEDQLLRNQFD
jgi:hypothetical protein